MKRKKSEYLMHIAACTAEDARERCLLHYALSVLPRLLHKCLYHCSASEGVWINIKVPYAVIAKLFVRHVPLPA